MAAMNRIHGFGNFDARQEFEIWHAENQQV